MIYIALTVWGILQDGKYLEEEGGTKWCSRL